MAEKHRMRTKQFHLHLTEDEMRILGEKAELAGLSKSEFIRQIIVKGYVISFTDNEMILKMASEFNAIGININQIAKVANTNKSVIFEDVEKIKEQVAEMQCIVSSYLYCGKA